MTTTMTTASPVSLEADADYRAARATLAALQAPRSTPPSEPTPAPDPVRKQQVIVDLARLRASEAICARLRPRHRAIVARIAAALEALSAALTDEQALRDELRDADVAFVTFLRPMPFPAAGVLTDPNSHAAIWLREAREHGLID
jgi:hypothetical protein